jgi:N-acetylmuramoyl-L-alanine amidase
MSNFKINTTINYSPNFDFNKRKPKQIKFIVFHYTGMKREKDAINRLTSANSKVSCHYLIKNNGEILTLVPELYNAWHAGISRWKNFISINKYSIGIEISNPGHEYKYKNFSKRQIKAVLELSLYLKRKYKIKREFILGHSDISPDRKKDPGEKFPWEYLSKKKIGCWHTIENKELLRQRNISINEVEKKNIY